MLSISRRRLLDIIGATSLATSLSGCTEPTVDDTSPPTDDDSSQPPSDTQDAPEMNFSVSDGECGGMGGDQANSETDGTHVHINGEVPTPTPCYTLNAEYNPDGDDAELIIETEALGGMCVQCVGIIKYTATLDFGDGPLPDQIVVKHAHGSETTDIPLTID